MTLLQFKRHNLVDELIRTLEAEDDEVVEALVIGKRKSGSRFSFLTETENIPELIGYLEAIKADLVLEMLEQTEKPDE